MKRYINYKKTLIVLFTFTAIFGCKVDRSPELSITDDTYWKTANDVKLAANYFYTFLPDFSGEDLYDENWSDNSYGRDNNDVADGSRIAPSKDDYYTNGYRLIRATNKLLEKSAELQGTISGSELQRYQSEAYYFRAWAYFDLVRKYGNIQLVTKTLSDDSPELYAPAVDRSIIFDQIYKDLDMAAANLPLPADIAAADYGRVSKTTAWGLKSRVALFEGTRSKYHGYSEPNKHLTIARDAALAVMNSNQHSLYPNYRENFKPEGEGRNNKETMLVRIYGIDFSNKVSTSSISRNIEQGYINPTRSLVDSYLMTDGLPIDKSPLYSKPNSTADYFNNRDLRLHGTVFKPGDSFTQSNPQFKNASLSFNVTGFVYQKYFNTPGWIQNAEVMDRILMRYAEVLLNYAEAVYELNGSISDADLNKSINLLRSRAGIPSLTNSFVTANGLNMLTEIRRERRVELAQEGHRYWDLIRWKTAEIELPKEVYGNYLFISEFGTAAKPPVTADNIIIADKKSNRTFDVNRDYLWPLPLTEVTLSQGGLKQNPNW